MPMSESITSRDEHEDYRDGMADLSAAVKLRSSIDPLKPNAFAQGTFSVRTAATHSIRASLQTRLRK